MSMPGEKAKLLNFLDRSAADDAGIRSAFRIDILLTRSPLKKVKCGTIAVWRNNTFEFNLGDSLVDAAAVKKAQEKMSNQTEMMYEDPIHFRQSDGQWIEWALDKAMEIYDRVGGADIIISAPRLKIRMEVSSGKIAHNRSNLQAVFPHLKDIDSLLGADFDYDPWTRSVRRGEINAKKGGR